LAEWLDLVRTPTTEPEGGQWWSRHGSHNPWVVGSSPTRPTTRNRRSARVSRPSRLEACGRRPIRGDALDPESSILTATDNPRAFPAAAARDMVSTASTNGRWPFLSRPVRHRRLLSRGRGLVESSPPARQTGQGITLAKAGRRSAGRDASVDNGMRLIRSRSPCAGHP
jgi:hypothetical protein